MTIGGKVIIITGGAGALGRGVVAHFQDHGATAVVADVAAAVEALPTQLSANAVATDVSDTKSVVALVEQVLAQHKRIDGLVCLAGGFFGDTPVHETPPDAVLEQFQLNVMTAYTAVHAVLPAMLGRGSGTIVCVGSRPAVRPVEGAVAYGIAKLGVVKLVESVSEEYRAKGIRANAILPSIIDTPANREAMPKADFEKWVRPDQIARVLAFLCSDESEVVSGAAIPVYGRA